MKLSIEQRLLSHTIEDSETGCWVCNYSTTKGYPQMTIERKNYRASHVAYELWKDLIPIGRQLNHTCHNERCINPDHIYAGTQKDNIWDMVKAGRQKTARGKNHGSAKLTEEQVQYIRMWAKEGFSQASIAKSFKISQPQVNGITRRIKWKHLPEFKKWSIQ